MPDSAVGVTPGAGANIDTFTLPNGDHRQRVLIGNHGGFTGRFGSFRVPGRAGTTGQNLAAIWNAAGSTVAVDVNMVAVDLAQTVVKAVTVLPPIIRVVRLTAIPTAGTAGFKIAEETAIASNASVSTFQDASADGTSSATALASSATSANSASVTLTQEYAPRYMGGAGTNPLYEPADRVEMLDSGNITLRAAEGLGVRLEYNLATQNPVTDMWIVSLRWEEYTE